MFNFNTLFLYFSTIQSCVNKSYDTLWSDFSSLLNIKECDIFDVSLSNSLKIQSLGVSTHWVENITTSFYGSLTQQIGNYHQQSSRIFGLIQLSTKNWSAYVGDYYTMCLFSCNKYGLLVFIVCVIIAIQLVLKATLYAVSRCRLSKCTLTLYIHREKYNMTIALEYIITADWSHLSTNKWFF